MQDKNYTSTRYRRPCAPGSRLRHNTWDARVNRGVVQLPKGEFQEVVETNQRSFQGGSAYIKSAGTEYHKHRLEILLISSHDGGRSRSRSPSRQAQGRKENSRPKESYLLTQASSLKTQPGLVGNSHAGSER